MNFVVRVDDIGWQSFNVPDVGMSIAKDFHAAMQDYPYLAAVIPSTLDHDGIAWLQSQPAGMTIAMHGLNHAKCDDGVASEFRSMDLKAIRQRIAWGKLAMKDIATAHMVLPFNHYEPEVAEACRIEGVRYVWGGGSHDTSTPSQWPTPPQPYPLGCITFIPSWNQTYGATVGDMGDGNEALTDSLKGIINWPGKAVLTLHITWEYSKSAMFEGVKMLIDLIGDRIISVGEYLK